MIAEWVLAAVCILLIASPLLLTNRAFGPDWTNHLWLSWVEGRNIEALRFGYFVHADTLGVFYPQFAFYGGTLYSITGAVSELLGGHAVAAYVAVTIGGIAVAYGGWTWLSRQAGLTGWIAQLPGLVFITSAYYVTNLYGRGAWPELMATSAIPMVVASSVWLLRNERWRVLPAAALVASVTLMTGSHNITLVWGTVFLVALALVALIALSRHGLEIPRVRAVKFAGLATLGVGLNLWFLLPDLVYANRAGALDKSFGKGYAAPLDHLSVIFDPLRSVPRGITTPGLFVQISVLALAWALASFALSWRTLGPFWRRLGVGTLAIGAALLGLVLENDRFWLHLPEFLLAIQFPFRLHTYVAFCVAGLVLVGLMGVSRWGRSEPRFAARGTLAAVVLIGLGLAVGQAWDHRSNSGNPAGTRQQAFVSVHSVPPSWYDAGGLRDRRAPVVAVPKDRVWHIEPDVVSGNSYATDAQLPPGNEPIATNIGTGSYLVDVEGVTPIGRTRDGFMVVRRPDGGAGPAHVTIESASNVPLKLGFWGTVISLLCLLGLLLRAALKRHRGRTGTGTGVSLD